MWVFLLFCKTKHINKGDGRKLRDRSWVLRTGTRRTKETRISRWTLSWHTQASRTGRSASWYSGYSDTWMSKWDYSKRMLAYFLPFNVPAGAAAKQFKKKKSGQRLVQFPAHYKSDDKSLECSSQQPLKFLGSSQTDAFLAPSSWLSSARQHCQITCTTHSLNSGKVAVWPKLAMNWVYIEMAKLSLPAC